MKQYRKIYADYYGITWDTEEMEVHHIDYNRENNDISNLILLPRSLHRQVHKYYNQLIYLTVAYEHPSDDLLTILTREVMLIGVSPVGAALRDYLDTIDKCYRWSRLRKVGYTRPTGEHEVHMTPFTPIF